MAESVFEFRVLEPEERKGGGPLDLTYWTYRIRASTTLPMYPRKEMEVVRRYSDFVWFRTQLSELYPYCIVPPIPEKDVQGTFTKVVGSGTQGATRMRDYRQRALKKFLMRIGAHPRLHTAQLLQDFLEMDEVEWERKMQAPVLSNERSFTSSLGDTFNHALTRQWNTNVPVETAGSNYAQVISNGPTDPQIWEGTRQYLRQLDESIKGLRERVQCLIESRKNMSNSLHEFGVAFEKVGEIEKGNHHTPVSRALISVGQHSDHLSALYVEQAGDEMRQIEETLSYYHGMCSAVRETLKRLQHSTIGVETISQKVDGLKAQREKLLTQVGQGVRRVKVESEISVQEQILEKATKELVSGEGVFKDEFRRFHREKQYDMKAILKTFAELQLKYAGRVKDSWDKLLPTLNHTPLD